jgi:hypothetical protein
MNSRAQIEIDLSAEIRTAQRSCARLYMSAISSGISKIEISFSAKMNNNPVWSGRSA